MTPTEKQIACAEECGWKYHPSGDDGTVDAATAPARTYTRAELEAAVVEAFVAGMRRGDPFAYTWQPVTVEYWTLEARALLREGKLAKV